MKAWIISLALLSLGILSVFIFDTDKLPTGETIRDSNKLATGEYRRFVVAKKDYTRAMTTDVYASNRVKTLAQTKRDLLDLRRNK